MSYCLWDTVSQVLCAVSVLCIIIIFWAVLWWLYYASDQLMPIGQIYCAIDIFDCDIVVAVTDTVVTCHIVMYGSTGTVYPKKYAHGFVVLCFVVVMQSFIMNSHEVFIHIHQGCFAGTGAIVRLVTMYTHNKAQQSKNRVHISWDILYVYSYSGELPQCKNVIKNNLYSELITLSDAVSDDFLRLFLFMVS